MFNIETYIKYIKLYDLFAFQLLIKQLQMSVLFVDPYFIEVEDSRLNVISDVKLRQGYEYLKKQKVAVDWFDNVTNSASELIDYVSSKQPSLIVTTQGFLNYDFGGQIDGEVAVLNEFPDDVALMEGEVDYYFSSNCLNDFYQFVLGVLPPKSFFLDVLKGVSYRNKNNEITKVSPSDVVVERFERAPESRNTSYAINEEVFELEVGRDFDLNELWDQLQKSSFYDFKVKVVSRVLEEDKLHQLIVLMGYITELNGLRGIQFVQKWRLNRKIQSIKKQLL